MRRPDQKALANNQPRRFDPMTSDVRQPDLAPTVRAMLAALRGRIRWYVGLRGSSAAAACLGAMFWASLTIDWFFEPSPVVRGVLLAIVAALPGWVLLEMVLRRAFVPLGDRNLAMLLERHFPQFNESLLTAVELTGRPREMSEYHARMLARTCRLAAEPAGEVRLQRVFNPRPLGRSVLAAALLAASVVVFGLWAPEAFGVWARRSLLFSGELWPRKTRLVVEGFADGRVKVARGADLTVVAKADLRMPLVPNVVHVRYRTEGGSRLREAMSREGASSAEKDEFQEYAYTFRGVLAPIRFDVVGGDDAVRDLEIEVVDTPTIVRMVLDCRFPAYMDRPAQTLPVTGVMQVPIGTDVVIRADANKELVGVEVESALEDPPTGPVPLELAGRSERRSFEYVLEDFAEDTTLLFTLFDSDGIKSRQPLRLTLAAVADEPPELAVGLRGLGPAITPKARLPVEGRITDDHGLARTWFEYKIDQQEPREILIRASERLAWGNPTDFNLREVLDTRQLSLKPGEKLLLSVKAADRCDLADGPKVGTSERWLFDVVTAQQLRTMLESRELLLKERFKAIIEEVVETRDLLLRMQFEAPSGDDTRETPGQVASGDGRTAPRANGAEPGDEPAGEEAISPQRLLNLRVLCVQRALQNSQKDAQEVLGVAAAFAEIREELINNRIDTEELRIRLEEGIVAPLGRIAEEGFAELDRRLDELEATLTDDEAGLRNRNRAAVQMDVILAAMRQVLAKMIELEDFNEAVRLLREIIEAQERLKQQTGRLHKEKLRQLMED